MSGRRPVLAALVTAPVAIVGGPALAVTQIARAGGSATAGAAVTASATGASKPQAFSLRTELAVPGPGANSAAAALAYARPTTGHR